MIQISIYDSRVLLRAIICRFALMRRVMRHVMRRIISIFFSIFYEARYERLYARIMQTLCKTLCTAHGIPGRRPENAQEMPRGCLGDAQGMHGRCPGGMPGGF
jgi:hypothetical protein